MMNQTHERWIDRLSAYLDGDLDGTDRLELEAHLAECGSCRDVLADLRAVVAQARGLGDTAPARDLWPGIAAAIGAPLSASSAGPSGVIPFPTTARTKAGRSGLFLTMPQLAAASIVLALVSAAATLWVGPGLGDAPPREAASPPVEGRGVFAAAPMTEPSPELSAELRAIEETLASVREQLGPNTVRILEKNLGVIERAIDESRRALALDPGNAFLREHLDRAYRDKLEYLRQAAGIAEWTS